MKENKYDDEIFYEKYSHMPRSVYGLAGAGEWPTLQKMLPDFAGKRVLDLGCGFGWHCEYAAEHGANEVIGIDLSKKMLEIAESRKKTDVIKYRCLSIEDAAYENARFDIVLSSLALHYIQNFRDTVKAVKNWLTDSGVFIFSTEHPIFTAYGTQDWYYGDNGEILHFPVDNYFTEGKREAVFLGEKVTKYHRTVATFIQVLIDEGFAIEGLAEPKPTKEMLETVPEMKNELRRPMMLIIKARKIS